MGSRIVLTQSLVQKLIWDEEDEQHEEDKILMIRDLHIPKMTPIKPKSPLAPLGQLDSLPPEILLCVLDFLDFQSLSRLSRVSLRGKLAVEAMPAYREMRIYAPDTLVALGKTRLLRYHSAALLRQTLRTSKCASCFDFGGFLFLPTCERVCFECLHQNHALHMTTLSTAKKCFDLTDRQLKSIPTLFSIPGSYNVRYHVSRRRVFRLVCVKQAKRLALEVHGNPESVAKIIPKIPPRGIETNEAETREYWMLRRFHEASLEPPGCDLSRLPPKEDVVDDDFGGMASIRMPYLSRTGLDRGRLCRGCQLLIHLHSKGQIPPPVMQALVPAGVDVDGPFLALMTRLRSGEGFIEHIKRCYGVQDLLKTWGLWPKPQVKES